jgi:hypothetical protein
MAHSSLGGMQTGSHTQNDRHDEDEAPIIDAMASSMDNSTPTGQETRKVPSLLRP